MRAPSAAERLAPAPNDRDRPGYEPMTHSWACTRRPRCWAGTSRRSRPAGRAPPLNRRCKGASWDDQAEGAKGRSLGASSRQIVMHASQVARGASKGRACHACAGEGRAAGRPLPTPKRPTTHCQGRSRPHLSVSTGCAGGCRLSAPGRSPCHCTASTWRDASSVLPSVKLHQYSAERGATKNSARPSSSVKRLAHAAVPPPARVLRVHSVSWGRARPGEQCVRTRWRVSHADCHQVASFEELLDAAVCLWPWATSLILIIHKAFTLI
jgi:hypothetical protein